MGRFRFVATTHHDVSAENLQEALRAYKELKRKGVVPKVSTVQRIEVEDENQVFVPVDRPLRAGDLDAKGDAEVRPSL